MKPNWKVYAWMCRTLYQNGFMLKKVEGKWWWYYLLDCEYLDNGSIKAYNFYSLKDAWKYYGTFVEYKVAI